VAFDGVDFLNNPFPNRQLIANLPLGQIPNKLNKPERVPLLYFCHNLLEKRPSQPRKGPKAGHFKDSLEYLKGGGSITIEHFRRHGPAIKDPVLLSHDDSGADVGQGRDGDRLADEDEQGVDDHPDFPFREMGAAGAVLGDQVGE
jgi:hypothetical protein